MSDRHDLRRQTREIQEALSRYDRDQLIDILVHVFRTYVLEGASLSSAAVSPSAADDLQGLSFAQVIERLQLRLELPELQLFELQGGRVSVRVDGRSVPLELPAPRGDGSSHLQVSVAPAAASPAPSPRSPGIEVREVVLPPSAAAAATQSAASRPEPRPGAVRATSAASAPNPSSAASQRPASPAAASPTTGAATAPSQSAPAAPAPAKPERPPEPTGTSGGGRFGLLEID